MSSIESKSSSSTSLTSRSSRSFSNPLSALPKIRRIQRDTTPSLSSAPVSSTHPNIIITKNDALRIFHGLTILFIGDPFLRTIFRDLVKLISSGHLLEQSEAAMQNGEYLPNQGEARLLSGGQIGKENYKDIRRFYSASSSTTSIYVHLPTIFGQSAMDNINFLNTMPECSSIDVVVFASYHVDLNFNKLKKSNEPFPDLLNKYASYLDDICGHLLNTCRHAVHRRQKLIWMKPVPPRFDLTPEQNDQFQQITKMSDDISQRYGFKPFDRYFIWERSRQELLMHNSHHFGCKGIRLYNQLLAEIIGRKLNRPLVFTGGSSLSLSTTKTQRPSHHGKTLKFTAATKRIHPYCCPTTS